MDRTNMATRVGRCRAMLTYAAFGGIGGLAHGVFIDYNEVTIYTMMVYTLVVVSALSWRTRHVRIACTGPPVYWLFWTLAGAVALVGCPEELMGWGIHCTLLAVFALVYWPLSVLSAWLGMHHCRSVGRPRG